MCTIKTQFFRTSLQLLSRVSLDPQLIFNTLSAWFRGFKLCYIITGHLKKNLIWSAINTLFSDLCLSLSILKQPDGLESKGLKVDIGKTKVMISGRDLHTLQTSDKYPYAVFRKGVRKTSIFCSGCSLLVHRKCSNIPGRLSKDPDFRCGCLGNAKAIDGRPCVEVQLADGKVDVVDNFVYLGDCICPGGDWELVTIRRCRSAWQKFREPLLLLTCQVISLNKLSQT